MGTTTEAQNWHTHDAGLFHWDWNYFTDASVDAGVQQFNEAAKDGVSGQEIVDLVTTSIDYAQITAREARQIYGALQSHHADMDQYSRSVADLVEQSLDATYPWGWVSGDPFFDRPHADPTPLSSQNDEDYRRAEDYSAINALDAYTFRDQIQEEADFQNLSKALNLRG